MSLLLNSILFWNFSHQIKTAPFYRSCSKTGMSAATLDVSCWYPETAQTYLLPRATTFYLKTKQTADLT